MTRREPRNAQASPGFSRIGYDTGVEYLARRIHKWIVIKRAMPLRREAHLSELYQQTCREVDAAYPQHLARFQMMYANCRTDKERYALVEFTLNGIAQARLWWAWYLQREALVQTLGQWTDDQED